MYKEFITKILSGSFYYGFSSILGKAIGFFMLPIYTSVLTPSDYGVISFLMLYVTFAQLLFGSRMDQAVTKLYSDDPTQNNLGEIWYAAVLTSAVLTSVPLIISISIPSLISQLLFSTEIYKDVVLIFSINIVFLITENYGLLFLRLHEKQKYYLLVNLTKLILQLGLNVWLIVLNDYGIIGVAISSISASIFVTVVTFVYAFKTITHVHFIARQAKKLVKFSIPLWATAIFGLYTSSIQQPLLNYISGIGAVGLFSLSATIATLVLILLWQPFFSYWQVERFNIARNHQNPKTIFSMVFETATLISILASLFLGIFSHTAIKYMSAEEFHTAYKATFPLTLSMSLMYLSYLLNFPFLLKNKNKYIFNIYFFSSISLTLLLVVLTFNYGFVGAAWALMLNNWIIVNITYYFSMKFYDMGVSITKFNIAIILVSVIYLAAEGTILPNESQIGFISSLLTFIFSSLIIIAAHIIFLNRNFSFSDAFDLIKRIQKKTLK